MSRTESDRNTTLTQLNHFRRRILPGALRRIASWKGIPRGLLRDWLDDVVQELAVDSLEHASEIAALTERERHARWMRKAEKVIYRHRRTLQNQQLAVEEPAPPIWSSDEQPPVQIPPLVALNNGRPNLTASIQLAGVARRDLRRQLDVLAARLGWDLEQQRFWESRAVEALTGMAADLLREHGSVRLLEQPPGPDIARRKARLHRLANRFPIPPGTQDVRRALRPWIRPRSREQVSPRDMLEQAVGLLRNSVPAWLWLAEACCSERDPGAALRALRTARRCHAARAAIVLGRARVLELRGKIDAALALLRRSIGRWPREHELRQALAIATAV